MWPVPPRVRRGWEWWRRHTGRCDDTASRGRGHGRWRRGVQVRSRDLDPPGMFRGEPADDRRKYRLPGEPGEEPADLVLGDRHQQATAGLGIGEDDPRDLVGTAEVGEAEGVLQVASGAPPGPPPPGPGPGPPH